MNDQSLSHKKIDAGTRLATMLMDHIFMTVIAGVFYIPFIIHIVKNALEVTHQQGNQLFFGQQFYFSLLGFALYFCKDSIEGRSIAKRILKFQVVDNKTGEAASPLKCFVRNLFIVIWPVEAIAALINPERRIGDRIAGTRLTWFDEQRPAKVNWTQTIISVAISYGLILLLMLPIINMINSNNPEKINYVESSYNPSESNSIQEAFNDKLHSYLRSDVRVYDQTEDKPLKYISVIFDLKDNYLTDDKEFDQLILRSLQVLDSKLPEGSVIGQFKYVYKNNGNMITRTYILPLTSGYD